MKPTHVSSLVALAACAAACVPMTFSEKGAVDFEKYRSVRVDVQPDDALLTANKHLAQELHRVSGFQYVTTNPAQATDLVLQVDIVSVDPPDQEGENYLAKVEFAAYTAQGAKVDSGEDFDDSMTQAEAIEDALDEVAAHYIRPYRY